MKIILYLMFIINLGCENSNNNLHSKEIDKTTDLKKNLILKSTEDTFSQNKLQCKTTEINIGYNDPLIIQECENIDLEIWESIISTHIIFKTDTINVIKYYQLTFKDTPQNLHFIELNKIKNNFVASYYYRGCVGDFCRVILKIEFGINTKDRLIVNQIYNFNEETQEKVIDD